MWCLCLRVTDTASGMLHLFCFIHLWLCVTVILQVMLAMCVRFLCLSMFVLKYYVLGAMDYVECTWCDVMIAMDVLGVMCCVQVKLLWVHNLSGVHVCLTSYFFQQILSHRVAKHICS